LKLKVSSIEVERGLVLRKIEMQVRETYAEYPEARIQTYGSMATGLAIDSSDMDLLISGVFPPE
jgi:DNA polymerase sigma